MVRDGWTGNFPKSRTRLHRLHTYAKGMPVLFMVVPCCLSVEISPSWDSWKGMCGHGLQLFNYLMNSSLSKYQHDEQSWLHPTHGTPIRRGILRFPYSGNISSAPPPAPAAILQPPTSLVQLDLGQPQSDDCNWCKIISIQQLPKIIPKANRVCHSWPSWISRTLLLCLCCREMMISTLVPEPSKQVSNMSIPGGRASEALAPCESSNNLLGSSSCTPSVGKSHWMVPKHCKTGCLPNTTHTNSECCPWYWTS